MSKKESDLKYFEFGTNKDIFENSNTFISNLSKEQLNKTALLPSTKNIQNKIDNYAQKLEMNKSISLILNMILVLLN